MYSRNSFPYLGTGPVGYDSPFLRCLVGPPYVPKMPEKQTPKPLIIVLPFARESSDAGIIDLPAAVTFRASNGATVYDTPFGDASPPCRTISWLVKARLRTGSKN